MTKSVRLLAALFAVALIAAACGTEEAAPTGGGGGGEEVPVVDSIGQTEGELNLIAWVGYTEDGTTEGYEEYDWVTPFEKKTGCEVTSKYADSSDEMVTLMRQGSSYDGVSASGDASNRLIAGGNVAAVDPALFPDMPNVIGPLNPEGGTDTAHYIVDGNVYGSPYMYGPNFLMYNAKEVKPRPTSWDVVFEPNSPYAGQVTAYNFPIYIADAALYLMTHNPELGIEDPYELTQEQFDAAVELLKGQSQLISKYWTGYLDEINGFIDGSMVVGTAWPINLTFTKADAATQAVIPDEGVTGWADTWMMNTQAEHPNCMLEWMKWTMTPEVQAEVAIYYGAAGSNVESCQQIADSLGKGGEELVDTVEYGFCGNAEFLDSLYLWKTPQATCPDGTNQCIDYSEWAQAWTEIRGA
jgi:putative spermidine/putrescine transport system substrate-binding protein